MKDKKIISGIFLTFIFLASVGFSYAYFTSTITNKDVKDQIVETGTLSLRYVDGPEIVMNNIKPGATITKTVYVANTGTLDASYNLVWQELVNEITNDEMVIEATCTRMNGTTEEVDGTCENLESTPIKRIKIKENVSIEPSIVHKYDLTITFKEINANQNYNQGKNFTGTLGINEYVENTPIYCTFDGDMVQGAEYVNGQYTYRYMQEYGISSGNVGSYYENKIKASFMNYDIRPMIGVPTYDWNNIGEDGWGVILTDKNSTDPIVSKLCTYINNKPVISTSYMFHTSKATSIDLSSFNTSNIINMSNMFLFDNAISLDLSGFNTSRVTDMSGMFSFSKATSIDLSHLDTSNVTNMSEMFSYSEASSLDLSKFNTSKVIDMSSMFDTASVETLDLSKFNTSKVIDMSSMFNTASVETLDLSNFDTSNVTNMESMFKNIKLSTIDLSYFDTSNVTDMSFMFDNSKLKTIFVSNKFDVSNVNGSANMFENCTNLVGGAGTKFNSSYTIKTYARVDGGTSSPGYFTLKTN